MSSFLITVILTFLALAIAIVISFFFQVILLLKLPTQLILKYRNAKVQLERKSLSTSIKHVNFTFFKCIF